jgi:hypothetical protein
MNSRGRNWGLSQSKIEMMENAGKAESSPREMTPVVCPCCGEYIPVELIVNAGAYNEFIEVVGINQAGYTEKDGEKPWPVLAIEIRIDEKKLLEEKLSNLLKRYEDRSRVGLPEL